MLELTNKVERTMLTIQKTLINGTNKVKNGNNSTR